MRHALTITLPLAFVAATTLVAQDTAQLVPLTGAPTPCVWSPECSTPGVKLVLKGSTTSMMGREFINYELVASGLPSGKLYTFWLYSFGDDKPVALMTGFTGDSGGRLTCADSAGGPQAGARASQSSCKGFHNELLASSSTFLPSEPYRAALISTDDSVRAYAIEFPTPVEATSGRCRLHLELLSRDKSAFKVVGEGFVGGQEARFVSRSGDEAIQATRPIPATGTFWMVLAPAVRGKKGGKASFSVTTAACRPDLNYAWGKELKSR